MPETLEAADLSRLREDALTVVNVRGLPILLILKGALVYAVENRCAHMGCPLAAGKLEGHILQCPCHDWKFDIRDGGFITAREIAIKTYAVEIKNGKVFLRI